MKKETLETILFWVGIVLVLMPVFFCRIGGNIFEWLGDKDYLPFAILFFIGSAVIVYSIYDTNSLSLFIRERSIFSIILGIVTWIYLIINIFVCWWWLSWMLYALSGICLIIFGLRNIIEKQ